MHLDADLDANPGAKLDASPDADGAPMIWRPMATLVSGVLYGALFPPLGLGALAWVALVPLVVALRSGSGRSGVALGALFGWVGTLAVIPWLIPTLSGHFERPLPFAIAFWAIFGTTALAPYYGLLLGAQAGAQRRLPVGLFPWLFAAAWTAAEWLRIELGFRSPWTRLGDAAVDWPWLRQLAALFGVFGLSFLLAAANAVLAEAWLVLRARPQRLPRPLLANATALLLCVGAALAYGAVRSETLAHTARVSHDGFDVALVQGNVPPELRWRRTGASKVLRRYTGLTLRVQRDAEAGPPDLVVWPENAIQTGVDDPVYGPPLHALARPAPLVLGAPHRESRDGRRADFNSAFLLAGGDVHGRYDKRRLLPFSETRPLGDLGALGSRGELDAASYAAGTEATLFEVAGHSLAPLICMEALYPDLSREAARAGARSLLVLSNDGWFRGSGAAAQSLAMVRFRAIETGLPVLRATTTGVSAVIAPDGRVLERLEPGTSGVLRTTVALGSGAPTLYTRLGDAFALACLGATLLAVVVARWRKPPTSA